MRIIELKLRLDVRVIPIEVEGEITAVHQLLPVAEIKCVAFYAADVRAPYAVLRHPPGIQQFQHRRRRVFHDGTVRGLAGKVLIRQQASHGQNSQDQNHN